MINAYDKSVVKALDAVTSAVTGDDISTSYIYHAFQLLTEKGSTVTLEGSIDGINYDSIGTMNTNKDILQFTGVYYYVRARVSSFTSADTITVYYKGR